MLDFPAHLLKTSDQLNEQVRLKLLLSLFSVTELLAVAVKLTLSLEAKRQREVCFTDIRDTGMF